MRRIAGSPAGDALHPAENDDEDRRWLGFGLERSRLVEGSDGVVDHVRRLRRSTAAPSPDRPAAMVVPESCARSEELTCGWTGAESPPFSFSPARSNAAHHRPSGPGHHEHHRSTRYPQALPARLRIQRVSRVPCSQGTHTHQLFLRQSTQASMQRLMAPVINRIRIQRDTMGTS